MSCKPAKMVTRFDKIGMTSYYLFCNFHVLRFFSARYSVVFDRNSFVLVRNYRALQELLVFCLPGLYQLCSWSYTFVIFRVLLGGGPAGISLQ